MRILLLLPLAWAGYFKFDNRHTDAYCPKTKDQWMAAWEDFATEAINESHDMRKCLEKSAELFKGDPELAKCFQRHHDVVKQHDFQDPKRVERKEMTTSLAQYRKDAAPYVKIDEELQDPAFLKDVAKGNIEGAETYLKALNLKREKAGKPPFEWIKFLGQAPSTDMPPGDSRFLVYDPGAKGFPRTEKWINFTIPDPGVQTELFYNLGQLSVVATRYESEGDAKTYFADHRRETKESGESRIFHETADPKKDMKGSEGTNQRNCLECHLSGTPLPLRPAVPVEPKYKAALESINASMARVPVSLTSHWNPKAMEIGRVNIDANDISLERIRKCFPSNTRASVSGSSLTKVRDAMQCATCHDGETRSRLPMSFNSPFVHWVNQGAMPPKAGLSEEQREALANCLNEYLYANDPKETLVAIHLLKAPCKYRAGDPAADGLEH